MHRSFILTACVLGALSIALGAFGAHGLKQYVPEATVNTFETGVRYQYYHVLALALTGILYEKFPGRWMRYAGTCFLGGIVLFSGSLYLLVLLKATEVVGLSGVGIITPFGGLFFIAGWICLFLGVAGKK